MKILYVPCKSKVTVDLSGLKNKLPKNILLFTTAQYIGQIDSMKKQIGASVIKLKNSHAKFSGQILGCSRISNDEINGFDAILFVGDGLFHPIALSNDLIDVFCYNPRTDELVKLDDSYYKKIAKKKKAALNTFYHSRKIGVLISTKPGQKRLDAIDVLKKNYPDKEFFGILFDTLDFSKLLDFNFLEMYVNSACPRIAYEDEMGKPCINISDLEELKFRW